MTVFNLPFLCIPDQYFTLITFTPLISEFCTLDCTQGRSHRGGGRGEISHKNRENQVKLGRKGANWEEIWEACLCGREGLATALIAPLISLVPSDGILPPWLHP